MWYVAGKFEGNFFSEHLCNPCQEELNSGYYRDGYGFGDLGAGRVERVRDWQNDKQKNKAASQYGLAQTKEDITGLCTGLGRC